MEIVESPKIPTLEQKCKLEKLELPIKVKSHVEFNENVICNKVSTLLESTVKAVGNQKAKVTIQVKLNE